MSEGDLKLGVAEYLQLGQNLGKWIFFRLNSGEALVESEKGVKYKIALCPTGTADFEVIKLGLMDISGGKNPKLSKVYFLETKSQKSEQSNEQKEFQERAEYQGCIYRLLRSLDELEKTLPLN